MKSSSNHSLSRSNQCLDIADLPWKLYFLVFSFAFLFSEYFQRIITICAYKAYSVAIYKANLTSDGKNWGSSGYFLHWSKRSGAKENNSAKNEVSITSYIGLQFYFILEILSTSTFIVSWYSKVFCYSSIELIMLLLY